MVVSLVRFMSKSLSIRTICITYSQIDRTSNRCQTRCPVPPPVARTDSSEMYQEVRWTAEELSANIKYREIRFQSIESLWPIRWYQVVKTMALLLWTSSFNHLMKGRHRLVPCHWHTQSMGTLRQIIIATIEETSQNMLKPRLLCRVRDQPLVPHPLAISTYRLLTTPLIISACKHSKTTWKRSNKTLSGQRKFLASYRAAILLLSLEIIVMLRSTPAASNRPCNVVTLMREAPIPNITHRIIRPNQLHFLQIQTLWSIKTV